jgi:hypothetical protein
MFKMKFLASLLFVLAVVFGQVGSVLAAPAAEDPAPVAGTIQSITIETDMAGVTTVIVTVLDDMGATQTVSLSLETAVALGLVTLDPVTNEPVVNEAMIGQLVTIDPSMVLVDEEPFNPVAGILAAFFGVDNATINQYHEDGFGFGVIAQALWITHGLQETNAGVTPDMILEAKQTGDYSAFVLPDGSTPSNWGQFRKAALGKDKKNLGIIVSGHADPLTDDGTLTQPHGNGNGNGNNGGNGNGGNGGNGNGHGNGNQP